MEAYCVRCKTKREIANPMPTFTSKAVPATSGECPVCGTTLFRMGSTPAHEGLTPPPVTPGSTKKKSTKAKSRPKTKPSSGAARRRGNLVIVESPAKAKTIERYLGKGYTVKASYGHVRDLLRSQLSVDVENGYEPKYRVPNDKRAIVKELKADAAKAKQVYLATDLDREGEAIAWHLLESADIEPERARRVIFSEITKPAILEAFEQPRDLNMSLVNAQRTRRILDRLVGYSLSPLLWNKIRGRLSAGRVQSAAVRLIVDREREIDEFLSEEYWSIHAELHPDGKPREVFLARLHSIDGAEVGLGKPIHLKAEAEASDIAGDLAEATWRVAKAKTGTRRRKAPAPFTTSTLQQDASRRLNFTARRTMSVAQQLYEGIDVDGSGPTGLITYMRTDSTNVSALARQEARDFIVQQYGEAYVPETAPAHKTKARGAQEAHEAIRPTSVAPHTPKSLKAHLNRDQFRLYQLIWQRFVASQMSAAVFDTISVDIDATRPNTAYLFRASGSNLRFKGFLAVYEDVADEDAASENGSSDQALPVLSAEQVLTLLRLLPEQHFTQPPPRYTEASLVRTLEEFGIGRPSTYAPIITTIQNRGYVEREGKRLFPTDIGILVNDMLVAHFPNIVDLNFTAELEDQLDQIADGEQAWRPVIDEFWQPFSQQLVEAEEQMPEVSTEPEQVGRDCPECGNPLIIRFGRYGKFIGCSNFPECRHVEPLLETIGVTCPNCGGELVERRTKKGRTFFGCSNYPACDFTSWKRPIAQPCPHCEGLLVIANRQNARCLNCGEFTPLSELEQSAELTEA